MSKFSHFVFAFFLLIFSMCMSSFVFAVDSTQVVTITSADYPITSIRRSYLLYQSQVANNYPNNIRNLGVQTTDSLARLNCLTGYSACVALHQIDSNDLNPSEAGLGQIYSQGTITKNPEGGYKITYIQGYVVHGFSGGRDDRGGNFTYTITCVPQENLAPGAKKASVNGVGPVCVDQ